MIAFDIFLPIPGKLAEKKPSIKAKTKSVASKKARQLYGQSVMVVEPYDPNYYDHKKR